jgi:hypothetical protein
MMNPSTTQPTSPAMLPPTDPAATFPYGWPKYVTINAHTAPGGDWVACVNLSPRFGVPLARSAGILEHLPAENTRHETIHLIADESYRARFGGLNSAVSGSSRKPIELF